MVAMVMAFGSYSSRESTDAKLTTEELSDVDRVYVRSCYRLERTTSKSKQRAPARSASIVHKKRKLRRGSLSLTYRVSAYKETLKTFRAMEKKTAIR